jgi:hypothetical protein
MAIIEPKETFKTSVGAIYCPMIVGSIPKSL